ncbi:MAG: hypothetical protein DHS20C16_20710 [Phycisphaerae bacterium]|nr:MAG: hypothetical protein DHS20C16_20710 [Phycisphaerae bacterium]
MLLWEAVSGNDVTKPPAQSKVKAISTRPRSLRVSDRCGAQTRVGRRCRCRKANGSDFCNFHDPEISARIRAASAAKRDARKQQLAALPEGYLKTLANTDGIVNALETVYREVRLGVISTRTASVLLAIVDRMIAYDKLISTVGRRRTTKLQRAKELRMLVSDLMEDMEARGPAKQVASNSKSVPAALPAAKGKPRRKSQQGVG